MGVRVWCWLRLVFLLSAVFWYVFVCVSVVFQLLLIVTFPETNNTWHLKHTCLEDDDHLLLGQLQPVWRAFEAEIRC